MLVFITQSRSMTNFAHNGCCRSLKSPLAAIAAENKARKALDRLRPLKDSWKIISGALTVSNRSIVLESDKLK